MKKLYVILMLMGLASAKPFAQSNTAKEGIYLNWQDFQNHKIMLVDKLKLNDFVSSKYIEVYSNGLKTTYCKDSIFGYKNAEGKAFRFYKSYDDEYQIVETGPVLIYVNYEQNHTSKGLSVGSTPLYYFSKTPGSQILPLNVLNLKREFPDAEKLHHMLDISFGDGTPISLYDSTHKMYTVNYLLKVYLIK